MCCIEFDQRMQVHRNSEPDATDLPNRIQSAQGVLQSVQGDHSNAAHLIETLETTCADLHLQV